MSRYVAVTYRNVGSERKYGKKREQIEMSSLFSYCEVFADAKVVVLCTVKLLAKARSEVKLAHFAEGKTSLSAG